MILLLLLGLPQAVSISYSEGIYNLTNSYASYYVNETGFQVSNVPNEWWSHNLVCIRLTVAGIPERCVDTLPWTWTNFTNGNFAQLNGTTSWLFAVGRNVTVKMQYYLDDVDTRIKMNMSITYLGSRTVAGELIWRSHDIQIGGDSANDYINLEISETNNTYYALNTSGLNNSYTSLYEKSYMLFDTTKGAAHTYWDDSTYNLTVIKTNETNAVVDLRRPFNLGTLGTAYFGMYWSDPLCSFSGCSLILPSADITLQECTNTTMKAQFKTPLIVGSPDCYDYLGYIHFYYNNGTANHIQPYPWQGNITCYGAGCYGAIWMEGPLYYIASPMAIDYRVSTYTIYATCEWGDSGVRTSGTTRLVNITEDTRNPNVTITYPINNTNYSLGSIIPINAIAYGECKPFKGFSFQIGNVTINATGQMAMQNTTYANSLNLSWFFNYSYFNSSLWGLLEGHYYNLTINATDYRGNMNSTVWHNFTINVSPITPPAAVAQFIDQFVYRHRPQNYLVYVGGILGIGFMAFLFSRRK